MNRIMFSMGVSAIALLFGPKAEPVLRFDHALMADTLCRKTIDLTKNEVFFTFRNVGKNPVVMLRVRSGDPDYACRVPREPIKPNQKDSIGICLVPQQLVSNVNRTYWVEYAEVGASVDTVILRLKRVVTDCND